MKRGEVEKLSDIEFCRIDEEEIQTLDDSIKYLWSMLYNPLCYYSDFAKDIGMMEGKVRVANYKGLKIVIRLNEHPPPHFEVLVNNFKACFRIEDCFHFVGKISDRDKKMIRKWYKLKGNKEKLIEEWDKSRPYGCVVGRYRGTPRDEE